MPHSISGFNQDKLVALGLDDRDARILRWFVNFKDSGQMVSREEDDGTYYWVLYKHVLEEFPAMRIHEPKVMGRRFKRYVQAGLLTPLLKKQGGTWTYFRPLPGLEDLQLVEEDFEGTGNSKVPYQGTIKSPARELKSPTKDIGTKDIGTSYTGTIDPREDYIVPDIQDFEVPCPGVAEGPEALGSDDYLEGKTDNSSSTIDFHSSPGSEDINQSDQGTLKSPGPEGGAVTYSSPSTSIEEIIRIIEQRKGVTLVERARDELYKCIRLDYTVDPGGQDRIHILHPNRMVRATGMYAYWLNRSGITDLLYDTSLGTFTHEQAMGDVIDKAEDAMIFRRIEAREARERAAQEAEAKREARIREVSFAD